VESTLIVELTRAITKLFAHAPEDTLDIHSNNVVVRLQKTFAETTHVEPTPFAHLDTIIQEKIVQSAPVHLDISETLCKTVVVENVNLMLNAALAEFVPTTLAKILVPMLVEQTPDAKPETTEPSVPVHQVTEEIHFPNVHSTQSEPRGKLTPKQKIRKWKSPSQSRRRSRNISLK